MVRLARKNSDSPDEVRKLEGMGQVGLVHVEGGTVGRATLMPGWRWSQHVKPIAGTDSSRGPKPGRPPP